MWREERDRFKTEINIASFAGRYGYRINKRESSPSCAILDGPDRLIVSRDDDHNYWYAAIGHADGGTIIDFVRNRVGPLRIGQVRTMLRAWIDDRSAAHVPPVRPSSQSQRDLALRWHRLLELSPRSYLAESCLNWATVRERTVKQDAHGNAYFPARDESGDITGIYTYGRGVDGYEARSGAGIYVDAVRSAQGIVITDNPIDGLSYEQIKGKRYHQIAIFGEMTSPTLHIIQAVLRGHAPTTIWVATGSDRRGNDAAQWITAGIRALGSVHLVRRAMPVARCWNDDLRRLAFPAEGPGSSGPRTF